MSTTARVLLTLIMFVTHPVTLITIFFTILGCCSYNKEENPFMVFIISLSIGLFNGVMMVVVLYGLNWWIVNHGRLFLDYFHSLLSLF